MRSGHNVTKISLGAAMVHTYVLDIMYKCEEVNCSNC